MKWKGEKVEDHNKPEQGSSLDSLVEEIKNNPGGFWLFDVKQEHSDKEKEDYEQ